MINAMIIDKNDDVVVAIEPIKKGEFISYFESENGQVTNLKSLDDITIYHKIAIKNIKKNTPVVKYGEHIGLSSKDILKGEHLHTHNIENCRENL